MRSRADMVGCTCFFKHTGCRWVQLVRRLKFITHTPKPEDAGRRFSSRIYQLKQNGAIWLCFIVWRLVIFDKGSRCGMTLQPFFTLRNCFLSEERNLVESTQYILEFAGWCGCKFSQRGWVGTNWIPYHPELGSGSGVSYNGIDRRASDVQRQFSHNIFVQSLECCLLSRFLGAHIWKMIFF